MDGHQGKYQILVLMGPDWTLPRMVSGEGGLHGCTGLQPTCHLQQEYYTSEVLRKTQKGEEESIIMNNVFEILNMLLLLPL